MDRNGWPYDIQNAGRFAEKNLIKGTPITHTGANMNRPTNVVLASATAIVGGIVAIAAMAWVFSNEITSTDSFSYLLGILLVAVLFFASAGFLYQNGKGNYYGCLIVELINVIVSAAFICLNVKGEYQFGIAFLVISILVVIFTLPSKAERWMALDRI